MGTGIYVCGGAPPPPFWGSREPPGEVFRAMAQYGNDSGRNDRWYWAIALGLIITGIAAPVGILMIVMKMLNGDDNKKKAPQTAAGQQQNLGARTSTSAYRGQSAPQQMSRPSTAPAGQKGRSSYMLDRLAKKGKSLTLWGGILTAIFSISFLTTAAEYLWVLPDIAWFLQETVPLLCFTAVGGGMLWTGLRRKKRARLFRQYLNMIGGKKVVSISSLASATGTAPEKVRETLEDMLEYDLFPAGYVDYGGDQLILSGAGVGEKPKAAPAAKAAPEESPENAVLKEIRAVNDDIDNEKLSAQIDRIGVITAKIFDYQKSHPDKSPQLHSFLSYYRPTTLKILRAYAQLEDQEVAGENITAAMERIESMMDKVVEGFETQLDLLFQGDAMDITADVEVLERMLAKDGLAEHQGLTLGG